jgi:peptidoglycan/LPS O-acetylase OafA/YrhL
MYLIYAYFVIFGIIVLSYYFIDKNIKQFSIPDKSKYIQLDGIRGILATSVIFHHSIIMYNFFVYGKWETPPSDFYTLLGQVSVAIFFIITGFLFGFKLFSDNFNVKRFFISRLTRIFPLQIFSVIFVFIVIFYLDDFVLKVTYSELFKSFYQWILYKGPTINHNGYSGVIETVYRTLTNEWRFYIAVPILFYLNKKLFKNDYILLGLIFILSLLSRSSFLSLFFVGIVSSYLIKKNIKFNAILLDIIGLISFVSIFLFFDIAYKLYVSLLLFPFFLSVLYGNIFQPLLKNKILVLFGQISYSIYLLHNIIIFIIFYFVHTMYKQINQISMIEYWSMVFIIINITLLVSFQTYKHIEHRFYKRSQ